MKDIRLFFEKRGNLKFISHLDMNRFFTRIIRKTGLNIWYTEGFNPHPYITFVLPLSLGFESTYEILDFKILDDNISFKEIEEAFKKVVPDEIKIINAAYPVLKSGKIAFADYLLDFENDGEALSFFNYLNSEKIVISKRTKRGEVKLIDVKDKIIQKEVLNKSTVKLRLPVGNENVNPASIVAAFCENENVEIYVSYIRTGIFDADGSLFK